MVTAQRWLCVASALLFACSGESNTPDAAPPTDMGVIEDTPPPPPPPPPPTDVPRDTGVTRQFGDPCTAANQCPGRPAAVCLRESTDSYPNGLCTRTCTTDDDCGDTGACLEFNTTYPRLCFPRCADHSDCRAGYRCFVGRSADEAQVCFPFCSTDAHCPASSCNVYSRFCSSADWMTRADNGDPCRAGTCRGTCSAELNSDGTPTGNLDGICTSRCTNPPDSEYNGANLPRGDCPTGSVCVRATGATAASPTATCRKECQTAADCRPGYICSHPTRPARDAGTYGNGYCVAMNCHFMTQTCPPNATCRTLRTDDAGVPTSGVCERGADGGTTPTDGAVDATATDVPRDAPSATDAGVSPDARDAAGQG
jgi:hypothetical protein